MATSKTSEAGKRGFRLAAWTIALLIIAIGAIIMLAGALWVPEGGWYSFVQGLGSAVFTAGLLSVVWEWIGKQQLADYVHAKSNLSREIIDSGVQAVGLDYLNTYLWDELHRCSQLIIVGTHPNAWFSNHQKELSAILARKGSIRVLLPNPDDEELMACLQKARNGDNVRDRVTSFRKKLLGLENPVPGNLEVRYTSSTLTYAAYVMDNSVVVTGSPLRSGKLSQIPTLLLASGTLAEWFREDVCKRWELSLAEDAKMLSRILDQTRAGSDSS